MDTDPPKDWHLLAPEGVTPSWWNAGNPTRDAARAAEQTDTSSTSAKPTDGQEPAEETREAAETSIPARGPSVEIGLLKSKSISFHWEFMFTRSLHRTPDQAVQGYVRNQIARLVDAGILTTTAMTDPRRDQRAEPARGPPCPGIRQGGRQDHPDWSPAR